MKTEIDGNVLDYWKLSKGNYIVKMKGDDGLDDDCDIKYNSGGFILSKSKRNMKKIIRKKDGFFTNIIQHSDTDNL